LRSGRHPTKIRTYDKNQDTLEQKLQRTFFRSVKEEPRYRLLKYQPKSNYLPAAKINREITQPVNMMQNVRSKKEI